jgi:alanine dehydrogenase
MIIGIPKEIKNNENRVAITPARVTQFTASGHQVLIEKNAGVGSGFTNEDYIQAGAEMIINAKDVWNQAEMILKVKEPLDCEYPYFHEG